jgi:hypothetical protein
MLVCVYYRVAAGDSQRVISAVREFQRTLGPGTRADEAQVLLRFDLPPHEPSAAPHDARTDAVPPPVPADAPRVEPGEDATVMETYRLTLPAAGADRALREFLAALETASAPIADLLRGARHVELFAPCAS